MKNIVRRDFIKTGVLSSAFLSVSPLSSCFSDIKQPAFSGTSRSTVAIVKGNDLDSITRDAIDAIGGMSSVISPEDKVFIKPNFVTFPWAKDNNCFRKGECTKPEIIIAVAEECLKAGASEVIIGEGSHLPEFDWKYAVTFDGKTNLAEKARSLNSKYKGKIKLVCLETGSPEWIEIPSATPLRKIAISGLAAKADKVISLPVAKTHAWAQLTLGAKNFLGITPLSRYAQLIDNTWWNRGRFDHSSPKSISQVFLDIVQSLKPSLTLVDFSVGIEANGPTIDTGGKTYDMIKQTGSRAVVASKDIMAADAISARIMNHDVTRIKQLNMGYEMGLGQIQKEYIDIAGESPENFKTDWKRAIIG